MNKWQALATTCVAVLLSLMTWFSATAVLPELAALHSLSPAQAAWLTNAVQFGFAVGALVASAFALADFWPVTRFMAASAMVACVANLALVADLGAGGAIAARFVTGVALAGVYPPAMKVIATWFKTGRGFAMGTMVGALTLGSALPHLVRATGGAVPWQGVVAVCSLASAAAALLFLIVLKEGPHSFSRSRVDLRRIGKSLNNRPVMLANIGYFGHMWELYAMWGWFLAFAGSAAARGSGPANVSLMTFAVIAMGAPGCLAGGWLADRIGRCNTTILMMVVSATAAILVGFAFDGPLWLFWMISLIWGFSVVGDSAQFSAAVTELAEGNLVGSSLALQMGVGFAITIFTIWLTPRVAEWLGSWQWTFLMLVPGPLIGVAAMWFLRRDPRSILMSGGRR